MPRKKKSEAEQVFDSVRVLIVEGIQLYKKIKPMFKRKGSKQNDNRKIQGK